MEEESVPEARTAQACRYGSRELTDVASAHAHLSLAMLDAKAEPDVPAVGHNVRPVAATRRPHITPKPSRPSANALRVVAARPG